MFRIQIWSTKTGKFIESSNMDDIKIWSSDNSYYIWLNLYDNDRESEKKLLESVFSIHSLAISDAQRNRHPPKLESLDNDGYFLLLKELSSRHNDIDFSTSQLAIFMGGRFIVTRTNKFSDTVDNLWKYVSSENDSSKATPASILAKITQTVADEYIRLLLDVEENLDEIEEKMFADPSDKLLEEIINYQTHLRKITRILSYHKQLFVNFIELIADTELDEYKHQWKNVYDHTERAFSLSTLYYGLTGDLVDGYISVSSHRLNQIMKVLTIITVIFVPLSFIAGVYGMNFENMPELKSHSGYFIILGFMFGLASILLYIFKRRKWI